MGLRNENSAQEFQTVYREPQLFINSIIKSATKECDFPFYMSISAPMI